MWGGGGYLAILAIFGASTRYDQFLFKHFNKDVEEVNAPDDSERSLREKKTEQDPTQTDKTPILRGEP